MAKLNEQRYQTQKKPKEEMYLEPDRNATTVARVDDNATIAVHSNTLLVAPGTTMENVKIKLDSLMEEANDGVHVWKCTVCCKTVKGNDARKDMRRHIETHLEGLSYPCQQCGIVSRTTCALSKHVSRNHRN